jgi:hypothetical protein
VPEHVGDYEDEVVTRLEEALGLSRMATEPITYSAKRDLS